MPSHHAGNILTSGMVNDLGLLVRNTLIILMEAQSTYSVNITLRLLMYLAKTYKEYVQEHEYNLYNTKPIPIPRPELYMVYVGEPRELPEVLHLSDLYGGGEGDVEVKIHVLKDTGKKTIIDQYIRFCEICDEQRKIYGYTEKAVKEILRICREERILMPFLLAREKEVEDIMVTLFDEEYIAKTYRRDLLSQGREEGRQEGRREGRQEGIQEGLSGALRNLIAATGYSIEKAMTILGIPESDRLTYREILREQ